MLEVGNYRGSIISLKITKNVESNRVDIMLSSHCNDIVASIAKA